MVNKDDQADDGYPEMTVEEASELLANDEFKYEKAITALLDLKRYLQAGRINTKSERQYCIDLINEALGE